MIQDIFNPIELSYDELNSHINNFMKSERIKSKSTSHTYSIALEDFSRHFKKRKFRFLIEDIKKYRVSLEQRKMKTYTISTYLTSLRRFCAYLVDLKVIEKNPAKRVHYKIKNREVKFDFLTKSQVKEALESFDSKDLYTVRDKGILATMFYCACNEEEIRQIMLSDLQYSKKKFSITIPPTKKNKTSTIINIPSELNSIFSDLIKNRDSAFSNEPLFISYSNRTNNKLLSIRGVQEIIFQRLKASEISENIKLTPLTLKHTAWLIYAKNNKNRDDVARRIQLKSKVTLDKIYKHLEEFDK